MHAFRQKVPPFAIRDFVVADSGNENKSSTIKNLLADDWKLLHPRIQQRFSTEPAIGEQICYRGTMEKVECSFSGKLFAHLTRLIANPLTPYEGENIPIDVVLYRKQGLAGVYWQRTYHHPEKTPYTVTSVKRADRHGNLTECVGAGFGMILKVKTQNGDLHFRSSRYFWEFGKLRIHLPHIMTPGETLVMHEDLGNGYFRFTISMNHIWLGTTFYQTGIFKEI